VPSEERVTYCRICEPLCGLVATVEDGRVTKLRPDADHPVSRGFACPKGIAMTEVQNDPDRVTYPLRRVRGGGASSNGAPEGFERVGWDEALDDIGGRLRAIRERHGGESVGWYMGNPGAFSYSHPLWVKGFLDGLGSHHLYSASSQDVSNRFAASHFLYGSPFLVPIPDLARTDLLFMLGANPMVSHGSVMSAPRIKEQMHAITERGGRVVVVDPRRTETAREFEHVAVNPDSDAWLLMSLVNVVFDEGLESSDAIARQSRGVAGLRELVAPHSPERTETRTGVAATDARRLAREIADSDTAAAIYGRTGSCLGRNGTLVSFLLDALALVTGNLDRPGGGVFGSPPIDYERGAHMLGLATYGKVRSRIGGFPDVLAQLPATVMAKEITTPGKGQMRALFVSAGNPVLSVPNGDELEAALPELELMVSIDLYVNDTNRQADYVLPATTFLEREDYPLPFLALFTTPFIQATEPVVEPAGEARQEWEVMEQIARRAGFESGPVAPLRWLGKAGVRLSPKRLVEMLLRGGPKGDLFGLRRGGLSQKKLRENPHGIVLGDHWPTGVLGKKVRHRGGKVRLDPPEIIAEAERLAARAAPSAEFPLLMIGMRELRSHNSWMHNSEKLMRGDLRRHSARIHPDDAAELGIDDGARCRIASAHGEIETEAKLTDEVKRGTIAVPHGWGHRGGSWRRAVAAGGANVNDLASTEPEDLERLAGMAHLNGIPVRLEAVAPTAATEGEAVAAA
jgi:anaerobic selenocysteine-containing dehydrogenase